MKKNLFLIFFSIIVFTQVKATDWFPIGAKWYWAYIQECCGPPPRPEFPFSWQAIKDTIILSKQCRIVEKLGQHSAFEQQWTYRYVYNDENGKISRFIDNKFLPIYDFNKISGDTSYIVTDSGNYSCDTFLFIIDSIKPLQQNTNLKVQYGRLVTNVNCSYSNRQVDYLTIIEKVGLAHIYTRYSYFISDIGKDYIRCYEDTIDNLHFVNYACDSIIDKVKETFNANLPIRVFPNPLSDKLQIEFTASKKYQNVKIELIDLQGRIIKLIDDNKQVNTEINLSEYSNGIYFLRISVDEEFIAKQIIVNH